MRSVHNVTRWAIISGLVIYGLIMRLAWHYYPRIGQPGIILNHGIAFGLFSRLPQIGVIMATAAVIGILLMMLWRMPSVRLPVSWILAGAIGNWTDRILWGGVVDYWQLRPYPYIFNLADLVIRFGFIWLVIRVYRQFRTEESLWQSRSKV
ncbi:Signal peptidase (SPase) II [Sulfobacillus thermosulfidooxidans DSM 9293]|uniref:Signal peptidase (SPase) II n=1 Tax=Sulfobacillus thermosulfidooxidans (strain DSM 9293 / VKM B-1269 / AT-1) TaxID=929705 RepID=A0A1W1WDF7_SULTA|nr:signal peptidase II [Sulfobacillus thermosulfidooxidans]SMC04222.1 Signal peptidase (SPase) II [Sulfobacillus thermosulfidooxidans DSM 9293]